MYTALKIKNDIRVKEDNPSLVSQQYAVYSFKCRMHMPPFTPKHRRAQGIGSLVGDHLRNISIEPDNIMRGFNILRKCKNKLDCLIFEMVFIKELKPTLNIRAMLLVMHVSRFLHSHLLCRLSYLYAIFYFTLI